MFGKVCPANKSYLTAMAILKQSGERPVLRSPLPKDAERQDAERWSRGILCSSSLNVKGLLETRA